jgi:large subunit ribosomal protein L35
MPKMKTNRAAAKRFRATASGKIRRNKAYARHILTTKTTKQKRGLRSKSTVDATNVRSVKRLLPYLGA